MAAVREPLEQLARSAVRQQQARTTFFAAVTCAIDTTPDDKGRPKAALFR
jgi:hypothetical protein